MLGFLASIITIFASGVSNENLKRARISNDEAVRRHTQIRMKIGYDNLDSSEKAKYSRIETNISIGLENNRRVIFETLPLMNNPSLCDELLKMHGYK